MDFTDSEIREELARLGYRDVPEEKLAEFKKDLMKLIQAEKSKSNSLNSSAENLKIEKKDSSKFHQINYNHAEDDEIRKFEKSAPSNMKEDWQYRGQDWTSHNSPDYGYKHKVPGSYSLYELPNSPDTEEDYSKKYDKLHSCVSEDTWSETDSETTKHIKRKTSRKMSNGSRVVDESSNACNGVASLFEIYEKVKNLAMRDCECGKTQSASVVSEPPYRIKGVNKNPSVIKLGEPPHTRNICRTVPFKRHQMYQKMWKMQPAIGDDVRHRLRKDVHSKMLQREDIKAYHKVFIPNPYVVPTEKPRYDLRWQVRKANALYEMPPHGFYHEI